MERGKNLAIDLPFLWWSFLWAYPSIKCRALESCLNDGHWWPPGHRAFIKTLWRTTNTPATVLMFRGDPSANRVGSAMEAVDRVPWNPCICMHLSVGFDQDESFRMCYNVLTRSVGYLVLIFFCGCCFFFSLTSKSQHLIVEESWQLECMFGCVENPNNTDPFSPEVAYVGSHVYDAVHIWRIQIVRVYITYYIGYAACKCDMLYTWTLESSIAATKQSSRTSSDIDSYISIDRRRINTVVGSSPPLKHPTGPCTGCECRSW